jgi:serine/threonine-protein kinase
MSDPKALVGQQIEQYVIRKHIARGGMADVYLAYEEELQRKVALKIMLPALVADEQYVVRFQREAQTVAQLDHANIVHVYAIGLTVEGRPFIAMQYIEGGSLRDTLVRVSQQGQLVDTNQALTIIGKMADALQVAHAVGIVHRDIKPSNILIRPDGRPVLVDLGIASVEGSAKITHTGTLIGTPHYMSPEQASGKKVDARSDLYSLGVILYELLAGRRPFEATEPMAVLHQHVYEQPPPLENYRSDLSPQTIYMVHRCLRKDPNERFQTATEMRGAINHVIKSEGGIGVVTQAGVWQPYPTEEYRLSQSKIMTPQTETQPPVGDRGRRKWLYALIPLVSLICVLLTWLMISSPDSPFSVISPPMETVIGVAAVDDPAATSPSMTPPLPTPNDVVPVIVEETAVPVDTHTPQPTPTPQPSQTPTPEATATVDRGPQLTTIGRSVLGTPIEIVRFGSGSNSVLFVGGLHAGSAPSTVSLAQRAITYFTYNLDLIPATVTLYVIPNANPDSPYAPGELSGRLNANKVDLNRNWDCRWTENARWRGNIVPGSGGPAPFSEPETQALKDFILQTHPVVAVFWEARAQDGLSSPGTCGSRPLVSLPPAEIYGIAAGYPIADFEDLTNQVLNGDGTNWIDQQGIPAIAILLPEYENIDWSNNLAGMRAILDSYAN